MKNYVLLFSVLVLLTDFKCSPDTCAVDDDFLGDLSSEDNRIAGELYLDVFKGSLDSLTYDYYVTYLSSHEAPSAKGLGKRIQCADRKYFKTSKEAFLIVLYYPRSEVVVVDNSGTSIVDSVIHVQKNNEPPNLQEIAAKMRF